MNLLKWEEKPHLPPFLPSFLLQACLIPQQRMGEMGSVRVAPLCRARKNLWKVQVKLLETHSWDKKGSEGAGVLEAMQDADLEQGVSCSLGTAGSLEQRRSPTDGFKPQYVGFNSQLAKSLPRLGRGKWHKDCAGLGARNGGLGLADGQTHSWARGSLRLWDPVAQTMESLSTQDLLCAGVREDEEDEAMGGAGQSALCCSAPAALAGRDARGVCEVQVYPRGDAQGAKGSGAQ